MSDQNITRQTFINSSIRKTQSGVKDMYLALDNVEITLHHGNNLIRLYLLWWLVKYPRNVIMSRVTLYVACNCPLGCGERDNEVLKPALWNYIIKLQKHRATEPQPTISPRESRCPITNRFCGKNNPSWNVLCLQLDDLLGTCMSSHLIAKCVYAGEIIHFVNWYVLSRKSGLAFVNRVLHKIN